MTVEEFKTVYPDIILERLIKVAIESLNKNKALNLEYDHHIVELTPRETPFCQVVIYYRNLTANKIYDLTLGELLFTLEDIYQDDKHGIKKEMSQHQKVILRIAWQLYKREK